MSFPSVKQMFIWLPDFLSHGSEIKEKLFVPICSRIQIRPDFRDKLIEQLKGTFGKYYDYHRLDIAANEVDYLNVEDPDVFPIVHGNLNIRGNRRCDKISLFDLRKGHMIWNYNFL